MKLVRIIAVILVLIFPITLLADNSIEEIRDVPTEFDIPVQSAWIKLGEHLVETKASTIILHWHGIGGYLTMATEFINKIIEAQQQGKTIIINLIGMSYSAHAMVTCYADQVNINNRTGLMFHRPYTDTEISNGYHVVEYHQDYESTKPMWDRCTSMNILTLQSIRSIYLGKAVYIININNVLKTIEKKQKRVWQE